MPVNYCTVQPETLVVGRLQIDTIYSLSLFTLYLCRKTTTMKTEVSFRCDASLSQNLKFKGLRGLLIMDRGEEKLCIMSGKTGKRSVLHGRL